MQEDIKININNRFVLHVSSFMYVFLNSFGIDGICMWIVGHDLSLTWRFLRLTMDYIALSFLG